MKTVLMTGATGMVGSFVLQELLSDSRVGRVISLGRRKTGIENDKLIEIVNSNFMDLSNLRTELTGIDTCFHCLGVYEHQVTKEEYYRITCDYQKVLTDMLEQSSPGVTFCLFGAQGADLSEKSRFAYRRGKGMAENLLNRAKLQKKYIFRPGYIHPTGSRKPTGGPYRYVEGISAFMFKLFPAMGITDEDLARGMVRVGLDEEFDSRVFTNKEIKHFGKD